LEFVNGYAHLRHRYHEWRYSLDFVQKAMLALGFACLVGLLAQVRIPLGFTPVPLTGQTFGVLLAGVALGTYWGGASMLMYVGIGAMGMPWFQDMHHGIQYATGTTAGYLVAFIAIAFVVGWMTERKLEARRVQYLLPLMVLSSISILLIGSAWLSVSMHVTLAKALALGFVPFIGLDICKSIAAAGIGSAMTTKKAYGPEVWNDRSRKSVVKTVKPLENLRPFGCHPASEGFSMFLKRLLQLVGVAEGEDGPPEHRHAGATVRLCVGDRPLYLRRGQLRLARERPRHLAEALQVVRGAEFGDGLAPRLDDALALLGILEDRLRLQRPAEDA
jgi:biotin transport system substrate-specific component